MGGASNDVLMNNAREVGTPGEGGGWGGGGTPCGLPSFLPLIEIDRQSPKEDPSAEEEYGEQDNTPPDNNGGGSGGI